MNRKRVLRIPLIVVLFLVLGTLWTALQGGPLARSYAKLLFQQNRTDFDSAAAQAVEQGSGQGIPHPFGVRDVTLWDYGGTAVDFSMGSSGIGSSTTYWGIQYVPSGERLGFQGSRLEGWISDGDGWRWEESGGDNRCYIQIPIFWIIAAAVLLVIYAWALIYGIRIERRYRFRAAQLVCLSELSRRELVGRGAFFAVTGLLMWAALELSVGYALSGGGLLVCLYLWKRAGAAKGSGGA